MTNLQYLTAAQHGLSNDQARIVDNVLLGMLSVEVPRNKWEELVRGAVDYVNRMYPKVIAGAANQKESSETAQPAAE